MTAVGRRGELRTATGARADTARARLWLLAVVLVGVVLPFISSALGLYDRIHDWGKVVHAVDGFCATLAFGLLLLSWRDYERIDLTDELTALMALFGGVLFGIVREVVEFIRDWVADSDLQKSNTDTMTDFLCNDLAAVIAMQIALRLFCRVLDQSDRQSLGRTAEWLVHGPSRLLDRHGFALELVGVVAIAVSIGALWFSGRPVPGIPIP
jgi:hypothetical protein